MSEGILIALIPSVLTFAGVLVTVFSSNKKLTNDIKLENNKVVNDIKLEITAYHSSTDEKIKALTEEVKKHNNFAQRMPVVESEIKNINEKVNHFHNI